MATELRPVIVAGASNQVAAFLLPRLLADGYRVIAVSRQRPPLWIAPSPQLCWQQADLTELEFSEQQGLLVYLAPMPLLPSVLKRLRPSRVLLMSSTSRFTKADSASASERGIAAQLQRGELELTQWARQHAVPATILRPTLIYGAGLDQNLSRMVRVIERLGFAIVAGGGHGLRQPVHADDLADAIIKAMNNPSTYGRDYNLSGGSTISYRQMVERLFDSIDREPRIISLPLAVLRPVVSITRYLSGLGGLTIEVLARMSQDLAFDHSAAVNDFAYSARSFDPAATTWQPLSAVSKKGE